MAPPYLLSLVTVALVLVSLYVLQVGWTPAAIGGSSSSRFPTQILPDTDTTAHPSRNLYLLQQRVVQKLQRAEALTIGQTGGSISADLHSYGLYLTQWLNHNFPPADGSQHTFINAAIGGSESTLAAICLDTMFNQSAATVPSERYPIDLLLVEYGYNDWALPDSFSKDTEVLAVHPAANYERLYRRALAWPTAVVAVEFGAFDVRGNRTSKDGLFKEAKFEGHYRASVHYDIPVVDVAAFFSHIADNTIKSAYYGDMSKQLIHPSGLGHAMAASLVLQELIWHMSMTTTEFLAEYRNKLLQMPPLREVAVRPYHGIGMQALKDNYLKQIALPAGASSEPVQKTLDDVFPLAHPIFVSPSSDRAAWECHSSRVAHTVQRFIDSAVLAEGGFIYGIDTSDGGRTRSGSRPGFYTFDADSHVVFQLPANSRNVALLVRKTGTQPAGQAVVWLSSDVSPKFSDALFGSAMYVTGRWETGTTQITVATLPTDLAALDKWTDEVQQQAETDQPRLYLHVLTIPAMLELDASKQRLVSSSEPNSTSNYFKVYGYTT